MEPVADGTPEDPRLRRNTLMREVLQVPLGVALIAATIGTIGGQHTHFATYIAVGVIVIAPLLRVCWLIKRWIGRGDTTYALAGGALLVVIATGLALALA